MMKEVEYPFSDDEPQNEAEDEKQVVVVDQDQECKDKEKELSTTERRNASSNDAPSPPPLRRNTGRRTSQPGAVYIRGPGLDSAAARHQEPQFAVEQHPIPQPPLVNASLICDDTSDCESGIVDGVPAEVFQATPMEEEVAQKVQRKNKIMLVMLVMLLLVIIGLVIAVVSVHNGSQAVVTNAPEPLQTTAPAYVQFPSNYEENEDDFLEHLSDDNSDHNRALLLKQNY